MTRRWTGICLLAAVAGLLLTYGAFNQDVAVPGQNAAPVGDAARVNGPSGAAFGETIPVQMQPGGDSTMPSSFQVEDQGDLVGMAEAASPAIATPGATPTAEAGLQQTFAASCDRVIEATLSVLKSRAVPVAQADPHRGLITTRSVPVDNAQLKQLVATPTVPVVGSAEGRYLLTFRFRCSAAGPTTVVATSLIVANNPKSVNPLGGVPVATNGTLEREILDALAQTVPAESPASPVAGTPRA
jgi:hypothetical protein